MALIKLLAGLFLVLFFLGLCSSLFSPSSSPSTPSYSNTPTRVGGDDYLENLKRHAELGRKDHPSPGEVREYLILDGRLGVQEGQWTKEDFEGYTHTKY